MQELSKTKKMEHQTKRNMKGNANCARVPNLRRRKYAPSVSFLVILPLVVLLMKKKIKLEREREIGKTLELKRNPVEHVYIRN